MAYNDVVMGLKGLSKSELHEVNRLVVSQINYMNRIEQSKSASRFGIGDRAAFRESKFGRLVTIRIDRINQKTISGTELNADGNVIAGRTWRVSPSLLSPAA